MTATRQMPVKHPSTGRQSIGQKSRSDPMLRVQGESAT